MRRLSAILALALALTLAGPVMGAKQVYSLALDNGQPVSGPVTFTATRTVTRITRTEWVNVYCHDASHATVYDTELPVAWGEFNSLTGHAGPFDLAPGSEHCWAALVTTVDYEPQNGDPEVYFTAVG